MIKNENVQMILASAKTCKECETYYAKLIEMGEDRENAKATIKAAKETIKNAKAENKTDKDFVRNWFKDCENIGRSLLVGICKENGIKFRELSDKYGSIAEIVSEYVTKADSFGQPIRKIKGVWVYKTINAQNVRSILSECVQNFVSEKNGFRPAYLRIETAEIMG